MDINSYLTSLDYDPRRVLSVAPDGSTQALPQKERTTQSNAVIICTKTKTNLQKTLSEVAILNTSNAYPGALIIADEQLKDGHPTPIGLPRAECVLSIDLPGLKDAKRKVVPAMSSTQDFLNEVLNQWNDDPKSKGWTNAARSFLNVTQVFSSMQAGLEVGFNAKWASGNLSTLLTAATDSSKSVLIGYFKQVYYTVTMDTPQSPAAMFADTVKVEDVQRVCNPDHPPAYIRSVDYGRILMIKMETSSMENSATLKAAFSQAAESGGEVGGSLDGRIKSVLENSTFSVVAIGGGAESAVQVFDGKSGDQLKKLQQYIKDGAVYSRSQPGLPIAYQVAFLKDNSFASMGFPTEYTETQCVRFPNGFVRFQHSGGYVAKVEVTWTQADANGEYVSSQRWESGEKTAGWGATVDIPGDARDLRLKAWAATGLVWDPWGEILNVALEGPDNKTYTLTGTTLNRTYGVS